MRDDIRWLVESGVWRNWYRFDPGKDGAVASDHIPRPPQDAFTRTIAWTYGSDEEARQIFAGKSGKSYTRISPHPVVREFEEALLEAEFRNVPDLFLAGSDWDAFACGSGMSPIYLALTTLLGENPRRRVVVSERCVYGGTFELLAKVLPSFGFECCFVDEPDCLASWEKALEFHRHDAAMVYLESVTNPTCAIRPIPGISLCAKALGITRVIDHTVEMPIFLRLLEQDLADLALYSVSKGLQGNSADLVGAATGKKDLVEKLRKRNKIVGSILSPDSAWMAQLGLATLPLRAPIMSKNLINFALILKHHPRVREVHCPLLADDRYHGMYTAMAENFGATGIGSLLAFEIDGTEEHAVRFMDLLSKLGKCGMRAPLNATHLEHCMTIATRPAGTTHHTMSSEEQASVGITPTTIRVSVGIEPADMFLEVVGNCAQALDDAFL